jgi:hypothetical protein
MTAQVRFKARLFDRSGTLLGRCAGTAAAKRATGGPEGLTYVTDSAVESMYERIAHDLFARRPAPASAPPPEDE